MYRHFGIQFLCLRSICASWCQEDDPEIPTTKHNRSNNLTKCRTGTRTVKEIELDKVRESANRKGIRECGQLAGIECGRVSVEEDRYEFPLSLT